MGVIIVAIGGYNIPQLEHRIVYIMGFLEILFIQTGDITLQENGKNFFAMLAERDHTTVEKG